LELLLDSGFQSGITDFAVHRWLLERR
jgi:hypothetical protein